MPPKSSQITPKLCQLTSKWSGMTTKLSKMTKKLHQITFDLDCQAGKEPIDQGILHQSEQSQDQQTNTPGPTCQHTRTNMPTHQDQHANTQGPAKINRIEDHIIK